MREMVKPGPIRPPYGPRIASTAEKPASNGRARMTPTNAGIIMAHGRADFVSLKPRSSGPAQANARRRQSGNEAAPAKAISEAFAAGQEIASEAVQQIRAELGDRLSRDELMKLAKMFRSQVVPRRKAGRQPKARITAAFLDWKEGMKGTPLFARHIPGWGKHSKWRRRQEAKMLMDAIRSRNRREATKDL